MFLSKIIISGILIISSVAFGNVSISCEGANEYLKELIMDKISSDYENVEFNSLKVNQITKSFSTDCDTVSFNMPSFIPLSHDLIIKVDSYKDDSFQNRKTQVYRFNGEAKIYKSAKIIHNKDFFQKDSIYESTVDIKYLSNRMISKIDEIESYQFRNYVDKNQIIENWMIEKIPDVNKGADIKAVYSKSNITLTLAAKVLENGYIGEPVKVKLEKNKKVMLGKIHDKETVIITSR